MADNNTFSLITVDAEEEDDLVIQAGAQGALQAETDAEALDSVKVEADVEVGLEADAEVNETPQAQRVKPKDVNAMITTEEDLRAKGPFVGMQRTILVVFVLLLVAFLAYWIFLR